MISNSAKEYNSELNCTANKNTISSKSENISKNSFIIGEANSGATLSVKIYEHYK